LLTSHLHLLLTFSPSFFSDFRIPTSHFQTHLPLFPPAP
jgi:hypothetical protein